MAFQKIIMSSKIIWEFKFKIDLKLKFLKTRNIREFLDVFKLFSLLVKFDSVPTFILPCGELSPRYVSMENSEVPS